MAEIIKNSIHTVCIEGYSSSGQGVAHIDGLVVFVKGALKGEECEIRIMKANKNIAYARIERVIKPSIHRVEPECPVFPKCGGCTLMHMDYEEELAMKRQRVEDALHFLGGLDIPVREIVGSPAVLRYRNKAIYAVGCVSGEPATGFFRERSHDIIPTDRCLIQAEASDRAAEAVRRWMLENGVPAYDEKTRTGAIRHVFCRCAFASGGAQVTVVSYEEDLPQLDLLTDAILSSCPETTSIVLNVNKNHNNTILAGKFITIWGGDYLYDELCGLKFKLSPRSFYQINHDQAENLYGRVLEYAELTGNETVLDLYCGTGTITLCLAKYARRAVGAEIVEAAVADAVENARQNGIENADFICADASDAALRLREDGLKPDVAVVDPPRKGLTPDVIATIVDMCPDRVVYVSCDPATLARDLKIFCASGYLVEKITAFDMFPRCSHVECVTLMMKNN